MLNLLLTVVAPVAVGFTLARLFVWWQKGAERFAEIIANLVIIWIIAAVVARNDDNVAKMSAVMILAVVILNFLGFLAGYVGGSVSGRPRTQAREIIACIYSPRKRRHTCKMTP